MEGLAAAVVLIAVLLGILLVVAFDVFCLVRLAARDDRVRFLPKLAWAVAIVCISPFGGLVYLLWATRLTPYAPRLGDGSLRRPRLIWCRYRQRSPRWIGPAGAERHAERTAPVHARLGPGITVAGEAFEPSWHTGGMRSNDDFGVMLRRLRARLKPEEAGIRPKLPATRRVPGLRRDELARLTGVSEEHLTRLEQGRRRPSRQVVDALAGALRLDREEHARLCLLAGFAAPGARLHAQWTVTEVPQGRPPLESGLSCPGRVPHEITAPAQRMLDRLTDVPVCVCDASWTVLAGNRSWTAARCGDDVPGRHGRNLAWRLFTGAPTNVTRSPGDLAGFKASMVADLRAALRRYPADSQLRELVADLRAISEDFARIWSAVDSSRYRPDRMIIHHPGRRPVRMDRDVMTIEPGDLKVVVFTLAPGDVTSSERSPAAVG
jgi:transcriptional regulator with XRE-family HTH domain